MPYPIDGATPSAPARYILDYALSPTLITWVVVTYTTTDPATYMLYRRARNGGATTSISLPTGYDGDRIVAAQNRVATVTVSAPNQVQILNRSTWQTVTLPAAASGLFGAGSNFATAVSGTPDIAGIYQIKGTGGATRVATAPGPDPAP